MRELDRITFLIAPEDSQKLIRKVNNKIKENGKSNMGAEIRKALFEHFGVESTYDYPDRNFARICL